MDAVPVPGPARAREGWVTPPRTAASLRGVGGRVLLLSRRPDRGHDGPMTDRASARAAKTALSARLAADPGVVGIGLARRGAGYVVKVDLADSQTASRVPGDVDGVRVVTEVVGVVRPL